MDNVSAFLALPSEQALKILTIEQLRKVAEHYKIDADIPRSLRKVELFQRISEKLSEMDLISVHRPSISCSQGNVNIKRSLFDF